MKRKSHLLISALVATCDLAVRLLPLRLSSALMAWVTLRFSAFLLKERTIEKNLRLAFPDFEDGTIDQMKREIARNFGRLIAELGNIAEFRDGTGAGELRASGALEYPFTTRGKAIYVTGHFGNWELLPLLLTREDIVVTIVHTSFGNELLNRKLMSLRSRTGAKYVEKARALRECIRALGQDESIAMLVDQRADAGVPVNFLGSETTLTHFPARMAMRFKCPIIVVGSERTEPGKLNVLFHEPMWARGDLGPDAAEQELTQRMATAIEGCIRRRPDQWFCNKGRGKRLAMPEPARSVTAA
jgi:KDO2-lipid IV(A) lauroyltransferase